MCVWILKANTHDLFKKTGYINYKLDLSHMTKHYIEFCNVIMFCYVFVCVLVGFSDRLPTFGDSFGLKLQPNCARPLLYETEPHQFRFQHHNHEPARGGCVSKS